MGAGPGGHVERWVVEMLRGRVRLDVSRMEDGRRMRGGAARMVVLRKRRAAMLLTRRVAILA